MLICPKCKTEYQEGYTTCNDCGSNLIEQPEVQEEVIKETQGFKIILFIMGILLILCSTILSYKLTSMYFIPNGNGHYDIQQFLWMLNAYQYSFLLTGIIACLPYIIYCCKGK